MVRFGYKSFQHFGSVQLIWLTEPYPPLASDTDLSPLVTLRLSQNIEMGKEY